MKNLFFLIFILVFTFSCKQEKKTTEKIVAKSTNKSSFSGTWTRSFELAKNSTATVNYKIYKDSIQYEMLGPMSVKYTLVKDTFDIKNNRWIGKRNNKTYVVFIKNASKDAITLLKMSVENKEKALTMTFPSDSARSKFSSWNTFQKK